MKAYQIPIIMLKTVFLSQHIACDFETSQDICDYCIMGKTDGLI